MAPIIKPNEGGSTGDPVIAVSTPTGLSATSGEGTIALSYSSGYAIPTTAKQSSWDGKQDALGYTPLNQSGDSLSPSNGTGFLGYPSQSVSPSTPATGFRLFADSSNRLSWRGANGYDRTFDGTANTANRNYTLPNASGTIALTSDLSALPNGTRINGVEFLVQNSKPTTRVGGSALTTGDRWFNSATGEAWTFTGTYFESTQEFNSVFAVSASTNLTNFTAAFPGRQYGIILKSMDIINLNSAYTADANNRWELYTNLASASGAIAGTQTPYTAILNSNIATYTKLNFSANVVYAASAGLTDGFSWGGIRLTCTKVGTPANLSMTVIAYHRLIV